MTEKPSPRIPGTPPSAATSEYQTLRRLRRRQSRLVVSIPALMVSYTLLLMVLIHFNLERIIEAIPQTQAAVRNQAVEFSQLVLYLGIAGAVASGGVGVLLAWQIVRPLKAMIEQMEQVARGGDLPKDPASTPFAEIGALSTSFNSMVQQLQTVFNERDRQMREAAAGANLTLDRNSVVISADMAVGRLFGLGTERLLGRTIAEALGDQMPLRNENLLAVLSRCLADASRGRIGIGTARYLHPEHEKAMTYSVEVIPMEAAAPGGGAYLVDVRDMSGMVEFQEQIQRADRLAALGTLATGIAHEIRNPLASIRGMTQLLCEDLRNGHGVAEGKASETSIGYLDRALSEIDRLERLVASIMDFTNSGDGPVVPVDLNAILPDVLEVCRHRIDPNRTTIELEWVLDHDLPLVPLEEARIRQALTNLISNAYDALQDAKGGRLRLMTWVSEDSTSRPVVVSISNSGPPIPPEMRARLFEPFFTTKPEGTGLGLPITYQIVVSNSGVMELFCEGGMIEFRLRFPLEGRMASKAALMSSGTHSRPILHSSSRD